MVRTSATSVGTTPDADSRSIRSVGCGWDAVGGRHSGGAGGAGYCPCIRTMQGEATVDISEPECAFWLDFDDDGEGDEPVEIHPDQYIRQETPVVGGCEFKLNTQAEATLVLVSELTDWSSEAEVIQEPSMPRPFTLHPGRNEISGLRGSMRIEVAHSGVTPRSVKLRTLRDGYEHQVQVPRPFRLLEVTIITPDGRLDRLEESVQSASAAYIGTQQLVAGRGGAPDDAGSDRVMHLAGDLLEQGYPQIAANVLDLGDQGVGSGVSVVWKWLTIILAAVLFLVVTGLVGFLYWSTRHSSSRVAANQTGSRRTNM